MLFPKSKEKELSPELFRNPTSEYRGVPFWAWNCKLEKETLIKQIGYLKEMGMGGFLMHSRTGMATPYLSEEYMEMIKTCVDEAEKRDMRAWVYDEDRWPSGSAGGIVTKHEPYRGRLLTFSAKERENVASSMQESLETGAPYLLARFDVSLNDDGTLSSYRVASEQDAPEGTAWYVYTEARPKTPWYNNESYVDTLNPEAIDAFLRVTHEKYYEKVGDAFDSAVPAIFTDEPQFCIKGRLPFADSKSGVALPWTATFADTFRERYGYDLMERLPELLWDLPDGKASEARYHYHNHVTDRFVEAFADTCGKWCRDHNVAFTGHLMEEPTLRSQTAAVGEAMRSYRSFDIPGIDMLCNAVELTTAKQAQSAARQYGRVGMISELYGVTNWDYDFRGHKFQGDWQAALGVTVRVPHLAWMSMKGEAKRDYPASIFYQSPWYREYPYVEDHYARVGTVLTRGKAVVNVAVVHPIESYWLHWGPNETTKDVREQMDQSFQDLTGWLLLGHIDFDFLCESLLPEQCDAGANPLPVGEMTYRTVVVPNCETLRRTTFERLKAFREAGGNLIFLGACPKYLDAVETDEVRALYESSRRVPFDRNMILEALAADRDVEIRNADGGLTDNLLYQMRQDGETRWLFLAHGVKPEFQDVPKPQKLRIRLRGSYRVTLYDTVTGEIEPLAYRHEKGRTVLERTMDMHDSLMLRLDLSDEENPGEATEKREPTETRTVLDRVSYEREEPNVLLLDLAEYALDDGPWQPREEILRADSKLRVCNGFDIMPRSLDAPVVQPWTMEPETPEHTASLRFTFDSEIETAACLALEDAEETEITFNGARVASVPNGYFTDESIQTVPLPGIRRGRNELVVRLPFGRTTRLEWYYILGDFNVRLEGCTKTVVAPTRQIGFSSITNQGLPFYGGNLTYRFEIETPDCDLVIRTAHFCAPLLKVSMDGKELGVVAYAPYEVKASNVSAGKHVIEMTSFGNRYNSFAGLHNDDKELTWFGPNMWRTVGDAWRYEYSLKDTGVLSSPVIEIYQ